MIKSKYLAVWEYGMGGIWCFIYADSAEAIVRAYPELKVVRDIPAWMTEEHRRRVEDTFMYDLDAPPAGLLTDLVRERGGPQ
jgi:hypothetical protein